MKLFLQRECKHEGTKRFFFGFRKKVNFLLISDILNLDSLNDCLTYFWLKRPTPRHLKFLFMFMTTLFLNECEETGGSKLYFKNLQDENNLILI